MFLVRLLFVLLFTAGRLAPSPVAAADPPRVAVFCGNGFPFYHASPMTSPRAVAHHLCAIGLNADLLDASALADGGRFTLQNYAAVILPYGNTYPKAALPNLRAFHQAGGAMVLSGIPFTHAVENTSSADWLAHPGWNDHVKPTCEAHRGALALEVKGRAEWAGVDSPKFPCQAGDEFSVQAWVQSVSGIPGSDFLFVRFFTASGKFLTQQGPRIPAGNDWQAISDKIHAPPAAAVWDLSLQVRSQDRVARLDDVQVSINGKPAPLPNPGFETGGSEWADLGHDGSPAQAIDSGSCRGPTPEREKPRIAPGDPLRLAALDPDWPVCSPQWLDPGSLPPGTRLVPALLWQDKPLAAILSYPEGAVTVWTNHPSPPEREGFFANQLLMRGAVAALTAQGRIADPEPYFTKLDALPRPVRYANVELPTPARPYPTFQPKMPSPADHLHLADVRNLPSAERRLLVALQGVVNRKQPRIFLVFQDEDRFWFDEMRRRGQTGEPLACAQPLDLVRIFREEIRGAVIPDPRISASACVAASLASGSDVVTATPELASRLGLPVIEDLRGRFAGNAEALRFLRTQVFPRLNPFLACCLDPASHDNGALDSIIAARGAVFWITGHRAQQEPGADTAAELEEVKALLAQMPLGATIRGFWWHGDGVGIDEGPGVTLGSRFGKPTLVSDGVANFSVYSGVPLPSLKQKPVPPAPALDRGKVYLSLTMSDGDNLTTWRKYFRDYFTDPLHGSFPVGWGMGPTLLDLAPVWAQWYYDHASPTDEFICDVSGIAYMYPSDWAALLTPAARESAWHAFYDWTQEGMQRMDMRGLRIMKVNADDIARAGRLSPRVSFLMPDYGYQERRDSPGLTYLLPSGQPVFRAVCYNGTPEKMAADIRSRVGSSRPGFANAFIWNWGSTMADLKKLLDLLGPEYVPVTPSQLANLYRQEQAIPGNARP